METLLTAVRLAAKDLRLYARDRGGLALGFLLPIALIAVFATVFGGMAGGDDDGAMPKPKLRVVDFDGTPASAAVVKSLEAQAIVRVIPWDSAPPVDLAAVTERVRRGDDPVVFVLGRGFAAELAAGRKPPVELVRELSRAIEGTIAEQAVGAALMDAHGASMGRLITKRGVDALATSLGMSKFAQGALTAAAGGFFDLLDREVARSGAATKPATVVVPPASTIKPPSKGGALGMSSLGEAFGVKTTTVGGEAAGATKAERLKVAMTAQSVAGTAVMMLLFGLVACGTTLLQEKEEGTLRRLLASPASPGAILGGKFLYAFTIGVAQLCVMFAFGRVAFGLPVEKHLLATLVLILATAAAATGFGVILAVLCRSRKQVEGLSTLLVLVMSAIGGSWFPLFIMPEWMQTAAGFTLTGWAMKGFLGVYYHGRTLPELWPQLAALCGTALVLGVGATRLFRRRV